MKTRMPFVLVSLFVFMLLIACGTSQAVLDATATPVPTILPTSIPGWNKFATEDIEIWLPDSFEGGDLKNDLDVVVGKLKALGPEYEQIINAIEANPSLFVLWVFDSNLGDKGFLTNMNITHEQVVSAMTLEMYVKAVQEQLPPSFTIKDQKKVKLGLYDAIQLVIEMNESGVTAKELMYVIKNDNTIWNITYSTGMDEFDERLPMFEQSANTFSIQP